MNISSQVDYVLPTMTKPTEPEDDDDDIYMPMDKAENLQQQNDNNDVNQDANEINDEIEIEPLTSKLEQCKYLG